MCVTQHGVAKQEKPETAKEKKKHNHQLYEIVLKS
jgi:hypothetical protein